MVELTSSPVSRPSLKFLLQFKIEALRDETREEWPIILSPQVGLYFQVQSRSSELFWLNS